MVIADYVEKWTSESKSAVKNGLMHFDLWTSLNQRLRPYSNTLNAINSNAARSFKQQDQIDSLRTGIKNVSVQTIPEQTVSWWDRFTGASEGAALVLLTPLDKLSKAAIAIKDGIVLQAADRISANTEAYLETDAGKKLVSEAAARAGMSVAEYTATPEGRKLLQDTVSDTGVKKLVTVLTVGSAVVLGSLAIWLLMRSRK